MTGTTETFEHKIGIPYFNFEGLGDYAGYDKPDVYGDLSIQAKTTVSIGESVLLEAEIDLSQLPSLLFQKDTPQKREAEKTKQEFSALVNTWIKAIAHYSFVRQQIIHPSFLRIIGMGEKVLPLILGELKQRPIVGWFTALQSISGKDVALQANSISEAVQCWIEWGKEEGYL